MNDSWQEKQIYLLERLNDFTLTLTKDEFIVHRSLESETEKKDTDGAHETHKLNEKADTDKMDELGITACEINAIKESSCDGTTEERNEIENGGEVNDDPTSTTISVPLPGVPLVQNSSVSNDDRKRNDVSSGCAICLCPYNEGDRICWSSNPCCPHVFHEQCIIQWLFAMLTRQRNDLLRRRARDQIRSSRRNESGMRTTTSTTVERNGDANAANGTEEIGNSSDNNDETETDIMHESVPKLCPCCRQEFIVSRAELEKGVEATAPTFDTEEEDEGEGVGYERSRTLESNSSDGEAATFSAMTTDTAENESPSLIEENDGDCRQNEVETLMPVNQNTARVVSLGGHAIDAEIAIHNGDNAIPREDMRNDCAVTLDENVV